MRTLAIVTLGLLITAGPANAQPSPATQEALALKVAVFSPQRAFIESGDGKAAVARLTALEAEKAQAVDARRQRLQDERLAFERAAGVLSEPARQLRARELERFELDVQRFIEDAQAELMGVRGELESAFLARLGTAVGAVAETQGLHLVLNLDAEAVAWVVPALDITGDVVRELDQRAPEDN